MGWTLAAIIHDTSANGVVCGVGDPAVQMRMVIRLDGSGNVGAWATAADGSQQASGTYVAYGTSPVLVACTGNGPVFKTYIGGVLVDTTDLTGLGAPDVGDPLLGEVAFYVGKFFGAPSTVIDEVAWWPLVASGADMTNLAAAQAGAGSYPAAVAAIGAPTLYWRLGDAGPTVADSSGHGHGGSDVGGVTFGVTGLVVGDANKAIQAGFAKHLISDDVFGLPPSSISSITPVSGFSGGGTTVHVVGIGFTGTTDVKIDGVTVGFTVVNDTHLTLTTNPHLADVGDAVDVYTPGGTASTTFTFTDTPDPLPGDCVTLTVPGLVADGVNPDIDGIVYTVESLTGWWDTPPVRSETMEAQPTGEYPTVFRENARRPVLVIVAHAPTSVALGGLLCWTAIATVKAAFDALSVPVLMEVNDTVNDRTALVRLAAPIRTKILGATVAVRIEISLLVPNPTLT